MKRLCTQKKEKVNFIAGVTKDLVAKGFHAGKLVKEVAAVCGGGGGGRLWKIPYSRAVGVDLRDQGYI